MPQQPLLLQTEITLPVSLPYLLYLPPDYDARPDWPLIIFLHGYGERGSDLRLVSKHGPPKMIDQGHDFPFIVVSPQCPLTTVWPEQVYELNALLDEIIAQYRVDESRVYLTGLSMGGYGTWHFASRFPQRFAAIAPICGGGSWWMPMHFEQTPIPTWIFHGDADDVVPPSESEIMFRWLMEAKCDVRLTVYPGVKHDSWTDTYNNPALYEWFLDHQRTLDAVK